MSALSLPKYLFTKTKYTNKNKKYLSHSAGEYLQILNPPNKSGWIFARNYKNMDGFVSLENVVSQEMDYYVTAKARYLAKTDRQLTFAKGQRIEVLALDNKFFYRGRIGKEIGVFPKSVVSALEVVPIKSKHKHKHKHKHRHRHKHQQAQKLQQQIQIKIFLIQAIANWESQDEKQLSFSIGDICQVVEQNKNGWWKVNLNGEIGLIPSNYFKQVPPQMINRAFYPLVKGELLKTGFKSGDIDQTTMELNLFNLYPMEKTQIFNLIYQRLFQKQQMQTQSQQSTYPQLNIQPQQQKQKEEKYLEKQKHFQQQEQLEKQQQQQEKQQEEKQLEKQQQQQQQQFQQQGPLEMEQQTQQQQGQNDNTKENEENVVCKICMDAKVTTLFLPCKHLCCCKECAEQIHKRNGICPMCRMPINAIMEVFIL
ncbi:caspase regulator [Anaeramoeba flamelloides]|uniref:Caspase regulator n=1 Tax=Anaeramoeba flamelloides TaxID=1746091 RepID=A0ABQ8Y574_9EUKA|nr:caspase regulator [Anaeramoeba flamelloides]